MKQISHLPRKAWILIALACLAVLSPSFTSWSGLIGTKDQPGTFLDAVAADFAKDPRLNVVQVNHGAGQIVVVVKPTNQRLTLTVTKTETKPLPDGQQGEAWSLKWKDESGEVVALGHARGSRSKSIYVSVPGLP